MPEVSCSHCPARLRVRDEQIGRNGRCPVCKQVTPLILDAEPISTPPVAQMAAPVAAPLATPVARPMLAMPVAPVVPRAVPVTPPEPEFSFKDFGRSEEDDEEAEVEKAAIEEEEAPGWRRMRAGLGMMSLAWGTLSLLSVATVVFVWTMAFARGSAAQFVPVVFGFAALIMSAFGAIATLAGPILCANAPPGRAQREALNCVLSGLLWVAFGFALVVSIGTFPELAGPQGTRSPRLDSPAGLMLLGWFLFSFVPMIFWLRIHGAVAERFRAYDLRGSYLLFSCCFPVMMVVGPLIHGAVLGKSNDPGIILITSVIDAAYIVPIGLWYIALNRRLMALLPASAAERR